LEADLAIAAKEIAAGTRFSQISSSWVISWANEDGSIGPNKVTFLGAIRATRMTKKKERNDIKAQEKRKEKKRKRERKTEKERKTRQERLTRIPHEEEEMNLKLLSWHCSTKLSWYSSDCTDLTIDAAQF